MNDNVLVIAAHPDDEILGCGGVMAKHVAQGDNVSVLIICEGITSRRDQRQVEEDEKEMNQLYLSAKDAQKAIGYQNLEILRLPDNRLDSVDILEIIKEIEHRVNRKRIDVVYTHNGTDVNIDHQIIYEATITACRPMPNSSVRKIISYEVASSTEWRPKCSSKGKFSPNLYIDIGMYWDQKCKALECYSSEMREWPHPRSIRGVEIMAEYRGVEVGKIKAEAFYTIREIDG